MPNWCQNNVTISGDEKKVKAFIKFVKSKQSKFDFNKIYPMPKELEGTVSGSEDLKSDEQKANSELWKVEFGADNWYDWKNLHWGTKWELNSDDIEKMVWVLQDILNMSWRTMMIRIRESLDELDTKIQAILDKHDHDDYMLYPPGDRNLIVKLKQKRFKYTMSIYGDHKTPFNKGEN